MPLLSEERNNGNLIYVLILPGPASALGQTRL